MSAFDDLVRYIDISLRDLAVCIQKRAQEKYDNKYGPVEKPDPTHEKLLDSVHDLFIAATNMRNEILNKEGIFTKDKELFYSVNEFLLLCKETYGFEEDDSIK